MRKRTLCAFGLCILSLAAACGGCSGRVSARETEQIASAVRSYVERIKNLPDEARERRPAWLLEAESVEVVKVEKAGSAFKTLVRFVSAEGSTARYLLVTKQKGKYRVAGVL